MKDYVNEILGGEYLEDEKDNEFEKRFGFSLIDLEEKMNDWLNDRFICYSVKELAYEICDRVYDILGIENADYNIAYKLKKSNNMYYHRIAFYYNNLCFMFDLCWRGNALVIDEWWLIESEEFEKLKGYEDIEWALEDEEEDY